jgi:hypothetical protein
MDGEEIPESDKRMRWRLVPDLRMVIPGDVICYRAKGNAAGGAAFTTNDRKDIQHVLRAVRTAQLWHEEKGEWKNLVTHNKAKDPRVKPWITMVLEKLRAIGIHSVRELRENLDSINDKLRAQDYRPLYRETLALIKECVYTTAMNTGHIVFAAGPAVHKGSNEYRIRVVHSTKHGYRTENGVVTTGVQEYYRRFKMVEGPDGKVSWTREMQQSKRPLGAPSGGNALIDGMSDDEENPIDDMEEDPEIAVTPDPDEETAESADELAGQLNVEVIAARMCF